MSLRRLAGNIGTLLLFDKYFSAIGQWEYSGRCWGGNRAGLDVPWPMGKIQPTAYFC